MICSHDKFHQMAAQQWPDPGTCPDCGLGKVEIRRSEAERARRQQISVASLQGMLAAGASIHGPAGCAKTAVEFADALIKELDREADDAE